MSRGDRYTEQLQELAGSGVDVDAAIFAITTADVRSACDVLRPVFDATDGADGRVSIEVDPRLAHDTAATVAHARQLWRAVDHPNALVKIPATDEGVSAITTVVGEGISVNVTLIFSVDRYRQVVDAYLTGLERAMTSGRDLSTIQSVASFFISRVDTEVDPLLRAIGTPQALVLVGRTAVANARLAFQAHEEILATPRWQRLASAGARPQRPLWASTGVKDPAVPDTTYVTELVVAGTVNTMPASTLAAVADHATITGDTVHGTYPAAKAHLDALRHLGIDYQEVTDTLERAGVAKFEASWDELAGTVSRELHVATA